MEQIRVSDEGREDAIPDSQARCGFLGIDLGRDLRRAKRHLAIPSRGRLVALRPRQGIEDGSGRTPCRIQLGAGRRIHDGLRAQNTAKVDFKMWKNYCAEPRSDFLLVNQSVAFVSTGILSKQATSKRLRCVKVALQAAPIKEISSSPIASTIRLGWRTWCERSRPAQSTAD